MLMYLLPHLKMKHSCSSIKFKSLDFRKVRHTQLIWKVSGFNEAVGNFYVCVSNQEKVKALSSSRPIHVCGTDSISVQLNSPLEICNGQRK